MGTVVNQKVVSYNYIDEEYSHRWDNILGRDLSQNEKRRLLEGDKDHNNGTQLLTENDNMHRKQT
jgi:hypothetical protein